jgi:Mn2+/Fe2+ NRAMP family transporter
MLLVLGPGLVAQLANTDAGSIITAAESGARWGYRLLLLQGLIIPVLYMTQELTVRLGLGTGQGYAELVRARFGRVWAFLSIAMIIASCFGALVAQMTGLAGVGEVFGIPVSLTIAATVVLIFGMVLTGSYHSVERIAIGLGLFELGFLVVAWTAHPDPGQILAELAQVPVGDPGYLYLLAANLGTSIMPWTIVYQQSAVVDKGLGREHLRLARADTLVGAVLCQVITAAIVIAAAATLGRASADPGLGTVSAIAMAFVPSLGEAVGRGVFALALAGGALVATVVVCLATAWSIGEAIGVRHSLEHHPREAPWFYTVFGIALVAGGTLVASGINLVRLAIAVGVINALLLPAVLGCLYHLARTALAPADRLRGTYAALVAIVLLVVAGFGVYAGVVGSLG